jgi:hypothetical protein
LLIRLSSVSKGHEPVRVLQVLRQRSEARKAHVRGFQVRAQAAKLGAGRASDDGHAVLGQLVEPLGDVALSGRL